MPTAEEYAKMSDSEKKKEDWMNSKWRPMMGWLYMGVCAFDFVLFPILWSALQAVMHVSQITQWQPLTLQGAGLFHIAMGAVLGIAALGRTQEKLAGANNGGATTPTPSGFTAPSAPSTGFSAPAGGFSAPAPAPSGFSGGGFGGAPTAPATSSFGSSSGFGAPATPAVTASGKKIVPTDDPVL
jgi:hypothetical protein